MGYQRRVHGESISDRPPTTTHLSSVTSHHSPLTMSDTVDTVDTVAQVPEAEVAALVQEATDIKLEEVSKEEAAAVETEAASEETEETEAVTECEATTEATGEEEVTEEAPSEEAPEEEVETSEAPVE